MAAPTHERNNPKDGPRSPEKPLGMSPHPLARRNQFLSDSRMCNILLLWLSNIHRWNARFCSLRNILSKNKCVGLGIYAALHANVQDWHVSNRR